MALRITVGHTNSDNMQKKVRMVHFPLSVLPRVYHVAPSTFRHGVSDFGSFAHYLHHPVEYDEYDHGDHAMQIAQNA